MSAAHAAHLSNPEKRINPFDRVRGLTSRKTNRVYLLPMQRETAPNRRTVLLKEYEHHMTMRLAAAVAAVILGASAPVSSALAYSRVAPTQQVVPVAPYEPTVTGSLGVHDGRAFARCPMSSAAEGNANQQNFPVKQYGQTSGGARC